MIVDVVLRYPHQVMFAFDVKVQFVSERLEQALPVHKAGWHREACASEDGDVVLLKLVREVFDEAFDWDNCHSWGYRTVAAIKRER